MPHSSLPSDPLISGANPPKEVKHIRPSSFAKALPPPAGHTPDLYSGGLDCYENESKQLLQVPDIRQPDDYSCGACCAMSVGKYWGVGPDKLEEWKKALGTNRRTSTHPYAIRNYLESLGLQVEAKDKMSLEDLHSYWDQSIPVIIPLREYGNPMEEEKHPDAKSKYGPPAEFDYGHFCTVVGIGMGQVFVSDPSIDNILEGEHADAAKGKMMIPILKFLEVWWDHDKDGNKFERYGIAVGPPKGKKEKSLPRLAPRKTPRSGPPITGGPVMDSPRPRRMGTGEGPDAYEFNSPQTRVKALEEQSHKFSSTQFNLSDAEGGKDALIFIKKILDSIADEDLAEDGKELESHITVKYGLHAADPGIVTKTIQDLLQTKHGSGAIRVTLGDISVFPASDPESQRGGHNFDVLKLDVNGEELKELNSFLSKRLEHTDTFSSYVPHITLAYLKPGMSWLYVGEGLNGHELVLSKMIFSDPERNQTVIDLVQEKSRGIQTKSVGRWKHPNDRTEELGLESEKESNQAGWRARELPGEWSLLQGGAANAHMESPGAMTVIHDQEPWSRQFGDRWARSEDVAADKPEDVAAFTVRKSPFGKKGFSKPALGNDYIFYERAFNRWRVKPKVIDDRRIRMAYERGTPPEKLAIRNDEEFRLTEDNKTKESQLYHSTHPDPHTGDDYQLGDGQKPVPNLDEIHIETDSLRGPAAKSMSESEAPRSQEPKKPKESSNQLELPSTVEKQPQRAEDAWTHVDPEGSHEVISHQALPQLPEGPPSPQQGMVRLYRGTNTGQLPHEHAFFSDWRGLEGVAKPFSRSVGRQLVYVDVPEEIAKQCEQFGCVTEGEYSRLPEKYRRQVRVIPNEYVHEAAKSLYRKKNEGSPKPESINNRGTFSPGEVIVKPIRPSPFGTKSVWDQTCPDGAPRPMGRSSGCGGHQANSWDGVVDSENESPWGSYPDYTPVTGLDTRSRDEKEEPVVGPAAVSLRKDWDVRCPDGSVMSPENQTCSGREGWVPWTEEERRQSDMLLEPSTRETAIDPKPGIGPMQARYPNKEIGVKDKEGVEAVKPPIAPQSPPYFLRKRLKTFIRSSPFQHKALDQLGGEVPPPNEMEAAMRADFITLPEDVSGTSCKNCSWIRENKCNHPKLKGLMVNERNCCSYWNADGTIRAWETDKTHPASEILHPDIDKYRSLETVDSPYRKALSFLNSSVGGALVAPPAWGGPKPKKKKEFLAKVKSFPPAEHGHKPVLAVDVDGTLCDTPPHDGPPPPMKDLHPREGAIEAMQHFHDNGWYLVIWTCRDDIEEIKEWLDEHEVPFDEINEYNNQPTQSPKVMARFYIDDRSIRPDSWDQVVEEIDSAHQVHQPVNTWEELVELGEQSLPELEELLSRLGFPIIPLEEAEPYLSKPGGVSILAPLKGEERAQEKVASDYEDDWSRLLDIVRAAVAVDSMEELYETLESLEADIVRKKDRFKNPMSNGYRDLLINLRLPSGMIAEIQFHLKTILAARERERLAYDVMRAVKAALKEEGRESMSSGEAAAVERATTISRHLFDQAWQEAVKSKKLPQEPQVKPSPYEDSYLAQHKRFAALYFTKADAPFTGEFRDSLGRRVCIANGRRIACGQRSYAHGPSESTPNVMPLDQQTQITRPSARTGVRPAKIEPQKKTERLLFAVIFNDEGKMLVKDQDPWGGFIWSAKKKKKDFIQELQQQTRLRLHTVGTIGSPEEGQGYLLLQAAGQKQDKAYPTKAEGESEETPKQETPKAPKQETTMPPSLLEQKKPQGSRNAVSAPTIQFLSPIRNENDEVAHPVEISELSNEGRSQQESDQAKEQVARELQSLQNQEAGSVAEGTSLEYAITSLRNDFGLGKRLDPSKFQSEEEFLSYIWDTYGRNLYFGRWPGALNNNTDEQQLVGFASDLWKAFQARRYRKDPISPDKSIQERLQEYSVRMEPLKNKFLEIRSKNDEEYQRLSDAERGAWDLMEEFKSGLADAYRERLPAIDFVRLEEEYIQLFETLVTLQDRNNRMFHEEIKNILEVKSDWTVANWNDEDDLVFRPGLAFLRDFVAQGPQGGIPGPNVIFLPEEAKGQRAYYSGKDMHLPVSCNTETFIHEFGHHLETYVPGIKEAAIDFLFYRLGQSVEFLHKMAPRKLKEVIGPGYDGNEQGYQDEFYKYFKKEGYYVGKIYGTVRTYYNREEDSYEFAIQPEDVRDTEIISMGLEALYRDPIGFFHHDLEYFIFMIGICTGELRGREW